jgi:flagellar biosynthesis/type III secretory pathway M-ring protein FliF/YscJ
MNIDTRFFSDVLQMLLVAAIAIILINLIVFPILMLRRMKELHAAQREIVKALQWMVDNWRKD